VGRADNLPKLSPSQRVLRARIGAYALHAKYDPVVTTAKARRTFMDGFYQRVDPDGVLAPQERERRATALRRAHFARMAYLSALARARPAERPEPISESEFGQERSEPQSIAETT